MFIHEIRQHPRPVTLSAGQSGSANASGDSASKRNPAKPTMSFGRAIFFLLLLALAAPFFGLKSISGLITLFIIYIGLRRAWMLTGRTDIVVMGPYEPEATA